MRFLKIITFQILILLLANLGSFAQKSFEGVVDLKYTGNRGDNTIKYFTKDGMVRIEMGENADIDNKTPKTGTLIIKNKKLFMLMPESKTYIEKPLNLNEQVKKFEKRNDVGKGLTKTGNEKDILGYKAEQWTLKNNKGEVEVWSTTELGNLALLQDLGGMNSESMTQWQQELLAKGFFPLLLVQHAQDGKELNRLEATNIDKKPLESNLFDIPSDYRKMNMRQHGGHN